MAYSNLQKFYKHEDQRKLMVYLSRRGMTCQEINDLTWDKINWRSVRKAYGLTRKIRMSRELTKELGRVTWQVRKSSVPLQKVFYKEMPEQKNRGRGIEFTTQEIWRICGEPHEMLLTKLLYFATMKITKAFITIKEL